tara:strand:+ start:87 stop:326 length:240 start_codon:yes stop_codon:yes gene_type:complete
MRNLLFVLVFISITILGCGWNKSSLENCADERYAKQNKELNLLKKSLKKKLKNNSYYTSHRVCEKTREVVPKSFDAKYQ